MSADLGDATKVENDAIATYDQLMSAKTKEVDALTASIEEKTKRIGELGVSIVQMKEDLSDTEESLIEDKKFAAELEKSCATKEKEWAIICKTRSEELLALSDTIKILNDDDALELFKKTLPGSASLIQVKSSQVNIRKKVLKALKQSKDPRVDFLAIALHGGKIGFEKIIKMIDNLVVDLKAEQGIDNDKKSYCEAEFDKAEDKKKGLELDISDLEKAIEDGEA